MNRKENRSSWLNETENKADDQQMPRLRFHENPSFEKITKNRCSGAWINVFFYFFLCMEFNWVLVLSHTFMEKGTYTSKENKN